MLLSESQHRVKNNLQIILSRISLQKRRMVGDGGAQRALDHIAAIALAHDQPNPIKGVSGGARSN